MSIANVIQVVVHADHRNVSGTPYPQVMARFQDVNGAIVVGTTQTNGLGQCFEPTVSMRLLFIPPHRLSIFWAVDIHCMSGIRNAFTKGTASIAQPKS